MTSVKKVPVKVITVGASGVGKTSLAVRFVKNRHFSNKYRETIGVEFLDKEVMVDDKVVKMQISDIVGQDRFQAVVSSYYRGVDCCVLVFDVTNRKSFESLDYWMDDFLTTRRPEVPEDFPFVVLGNKCEMEERSVTTSEARKWYQSKHSNINYFEVSAKEDRNVELAFETIAKEALKQQCEEIKIQPDDVPQPIKLHVKEPNLLQRFFRRLC